jgi:hypothetical protein
MYFSVFKLYFMSLPCSLNTWLFVVIICLMKIGRDGGILEPGTGPSM